MTNSFTFVKIIVLTILIFNIYTMKIDHIAIWAEDIDLLCEFYTKYFDCNYGNKYINIKRNFSSRFITFNNGDTRIEIMNIPDIKDSQNKGYLSGLAHIAISVGSRDAVENITEKLRKDGYTILSEPRLSGDGYYESAFADPEGNYVELLA